VWISKKIPIFQYDARARFGSNGQLVAVTELHSVLLLLLLKLSSKKDRCVLRKEAEGVGVWQGKGGRNRSQAGGVGEGVIRCAAF
jgi:hypothetical protein